MNFFVNWNQSSWKMSPVIKEGNMLRTIYNTVLTKIGGNNLSPLLYIRFTSKCSRITWLSFWIKFTYEVANVFDSFLCAWCHEIHHWPLVNCFTIPVDGETKRSCLSLYFIPNFGCIDIVGCYKKNTRNNISRWSYIDNRKKICSTDHLLKLEILCDAKRKAVAVNEVSNIKSWWDLGIGVINSEVWFEQNTLEF